jgi:hypothetical protein
MVWNSDAQVVIKYCNGGRQYKLISYYNCNRKSNSALKYTFLDELYVQVCQSNNYVCIFFIAWSNLRFHNNTVIFDQLNNCQLLRKEPATWSWFVT